MNMIFHKNFHFNLLQLLQVQHKMSEDIDFFTEVFPMFVQNKIFGLAPYTIYGEKWKRKVKVTVCDMLLCTLHFGLLILTIICAVIVLQNDFGFFNNKTAMDYLLIIIETVFPLGTVILNIVMGFIKRKEFVRTFNVILKTEKYFRKLKAHKQYVSTRIFTIRCMYVVGVIFFGRVIVLFYLDENYNDIQIIFTLLYATCFLGPLLTFTGSEIIFLRVLKMNFFKIKIGVLFLKNENNKNYAVKRIKHFMDLHEDLCSLSMEFIKLFTHQKILNFLLLFFDTFSFMYYSISNFKSSDTLQIVLLLEWISFFIVLNLVSVGWYHSTNELV